MKMRKKVLVLLILVTMLQIEALIFGVDVAIIIIITLLEILGALYEVGILSLNKKKHITKSEYDKYAN